MDTVRKSVKAAAKADWELGRGLDGGEGEAEDGAMGEARAVMVVLSLAVGIARGGRAQYLKVWTVDSSSNSSSGGRYRY